MANSDNITLSPVVSSPREEYLMETNGDWPDEGYVK